MGLFIFYFLPMTIVILGNKLVAWKTKDSTWLGYSFFGFIPGFNILSASFLLGGLVIYILGSICMWMSKGFKK